MNWMGTGWGSMDKAWDKVPGKGDRGPQRVWMPPETTQRHLFLDDDPQTLWEHNYKWNEKWKGNHEPCQVRNAIGRECPPCDRYPDRFPYFIGLHSSINMTPWFTKKYHTEVNFRREIYAARMGSKDKPGVLAKLRRLHEEYGRLRGLVFDVYRPGKKTEVCGSEFKLVEKIEPGEIDAYMRDQLNPYVERRNKDVPADKRVTLEGLLKWNPWEPFDFEEVYKPKPIEELRKMFAKGGGASIPDFVEGSGSSGGDDGGGDSDNTDAVDDDIPY